MVRRLFPLALLSIACSSSPSNPPVADAGPSYDPHPVLPAFMPDAKIFVSGHDREDVSDCRTKICRHDENVDMTRFGGDVFLVHRTAISQTLGPNSSLHVYRSKDDGQSFTDLATIPAPSDRDLRDPHFYQVGTELWIKALTRLPVNSARDTGVDTVAVATHSADGVTWSPLEPIGPNGWSYWRIVAKAGTYYSAAYEDGDKSVVLFSSTDGRTWTKGPLVYGVAEDTPLETELVFLPSGKLLALVRMDGTDPEYLGTDGRLRTKICLADPPFSTFTCSSELTGVRLDGPLAFYAKGRLFVVARKHLHDGTGRKRSALYELLGDADSGALTWKEHGEIPSAGDTAYAGYVMVGTDKARVAWYSGDLETDKPWILGMFDKTDIWMGTIDFTKLP